MTEVVPMPEKSVADEGKRDVPIPAAAGVDLGPRASSYSAVKLLNGPLRESPRWDLLGRLGTSIRPACPGAISRRSDLRNVRARDEAQAGNGLRPIIANDENGSGQCPKILIPDNPAAALLLKLLWRASSAHFLKIRPVSGRHLAADRDLKDDCRRGVR